MNSLTVRPRTHFCFGDSRWPTKWPCASGPEPVSVNWSRTTLVGEDAVRAAATAPNATNATAVQSNSALKPKRLIRSTLTGVAGRPYSEGAVAVRLAHGPRP